jgi:hypothetical protein
MARTSRAIASRNRVSATKPTAVPVPAIRLRPCHQARTGARTVNGWCSGTQAFQVTASPSPAR